MSNLNIDLTSGKPISPDLFGIFFEDINYAADGGLYAELIQNRSFEYHASERQAWNNLTAWDLVERGGGKGGFSVASTRPVHPNNPYYAVLEVSTRGEGVGLANGGFDGIPVQAGATYDVSFFARQLYMNHRWDGANRKEEIPMPMSVRLETSEGEVLAEAKLAVTGEAWTRYATSMTASRTEDSARFVLLAEVEGGLALDEISLFPRHTFRGRPNGLRADLAQVIADLKPRFVRFPGGCLVHGDGLKNLYRWQDTIGPIEQRRGQRNLWHYHQSAGLGYFEYFQFCEDIGAKPLPVVPAGVSCQNSDHRGGCGQDAIPLEEMPGYIQEVLELIEWATGPADSCWGSKRAEAGHPEPFKLEYLGVGNEDHISPAFRERFAMIHEAVKAKYPEITVVGTVGPSPSGQDFDEGWKLADELKIPIVDEHYYVEPDWFWENLTRYDGYDRAKSKVYLGEYAAHDHQRLTTLRSAIAEAAFLTALERNGDIVHLSSYAPLLGKRDHTQWNPDLIYFTNTKVAPTINYYVQQLFSHHAGDTVYPAQVDIGGRFAASAVHDSHSGDWILKLVNGEPSSEHIQINLDGLGAFTAQGERTTLFGDPLAVNGFDTPKATLPIRTKIEVSNAFAVDMPPHSLTVIRFHLNMTR